MVKKEGVVHKNEDTYDALTKIRKVSSMPFFSLKVDIEAIFHQKVTHSFCCTFLGQIIVQRHMNS